MNPRLFSAVTFVCVLTAAPAILRADIDRTHAPAPLPEPKASFPDYKQSILPNGLKIFVVENHREPTVTFRLLIKAGDAFDGVRPGLADTTAALLNRGTAKRTAAQFAEETDFIGASVEAGSGEDSISVSASGLTKDLPKLLDLFADAALHPVFPDEELAKQKKQAISSLVESKQRPGTLAAKLRGKLLYGSEHPYGAFPTEESLGSLKRDDLVKFHHEYFSPDNATLAVVGDIRADEVVPLVEKAFAEWKVAERGHGEPADVPGPAARAKGHRGASGGPARQRAIQHPRLRAGRGARRPRRARDRRAQRDAGQRVVGPVVHRTCARSTDTPTGPIRVLR